MKRNPIFLEERTRRSTDVVALIAFCGFLFFAGLQIVGLVGADEPRYAQVAREMLVRNDWVTPVLYGHPWLEKPPLYYWCAMVAYKASGGVSDWAARLPSALLCSLMVFFIYVWARHFRRGMQLDAALITAASAIMIGFGRSASTDMPLTAMFTVAMLSWYGWYSSQNRGWLLAFYLFAGFGTLAKGPVAVLLAGLIILGFAALRRDWQLILRTLWPTGILLYLVVTLPWFIAVQRANPEFLRVFFLQHNLERFSTNLYHHPQPFWFYLPVALLALVPWTVFVVAALVDAIRDWRFSVQQPPGVEDLRTYLTVWLLLPIAFFSLSQSKLPGYILPAIPAGTILLANFVWRREQEAEKPGVWSGLLHAVLSAAMLVAALIVPFKLLKLPPPRNAIIVGVALAVTGILALWLSLRVQGFRVLRFITLVPVVIAFALVLRGTAPIVNLLQSARPVEAAIHQSVLGQIPNIAVYDVPPGVRYGLAFYANQPVSSYEENEIPDFDHLVVAASGTQKELEYRLPGRSVTRLGGFAPQHLDFYVVSGKASGRAQP
ncbi:MAG: glycosyltransferase family 39 protein [Candidatus Korobacteraceae bacterium]